MASTILGPERLVSSGRERLVVPVQLESGSTAAVTERAGAGRRRPAEGGAGAALPAGRGLSGLLLHQLDEVDRLARRGLMEGDPPQARGNLERVAGVAGYSPVTNQGGRPRPLRTLLDEAAGSPPPWGWDGARPNYRDLAATRPKTVVGDPPRRRSPSSPLGVDAVAGSVAASAGGRQLSQERTNSSPSSCRTHEHVLH